MTQLHFSALMNNILQHFLRKFVLVFVDDILTYNPTLDSHIKYLQQVFDKPREHKLFLKSSKCSFAQQTLEYLGHIISIVGVSTYPKKSVAMKNWSQLAIRTF
jgi:hypothetical protein